ncbi:energy-coupling factor transporter transmembrane component T family protein [Thermaerobacillus caldiproteolyticus]|uniref:energy-coupling factor transporter transmembrane component T family protein n=1 Tax=Thermaerobacillus caldiproteolyticus TaxID=247480 RepID=UPI00188A0895|nr:energy-coupling factor transporter transmembrane component T [Anoxybacillus caldiproteolyticus]QPA31530.1 energy-coupling factor transporter transmembrane protein EcfT [Anoxybacillus caldiproteolyticus]
MRWDIRYRETWLHRTNPSLKLLVMLVLFIGVLFVHNPNILMNFSIALILLFIIYTGYPMKYLLLLFLPFLLIFISTASSMMLFGQGKTTWFQWGLVHITKESFLRGMHLGFRALTFALLGLLFSLTTRPVYLFYSLMQQLKLKPKYAYSFLAGVRLIPIMLEEFQTVQNALKVRGVTANSGIFEKIKRYAIPLLSQSIRRAQRIAVAMEAKRFSSGAARTFYYEIGFSKYDFVFLLLISVMTAVAYYVGISFPYIPVEDVR